MVRARRFEDLYKHVLFNYEWLHAKLSSCPLQAVLSDFEDACSNIEDREATRSVCQDRGDRVSVRCAPGSVTCPSGSWHCVRSEVITDVSEEPTVSASRLQV
jgi:hypothetical protein